MDKNKQIYLVYEWWVLYLVYQRCGTVGVLREAVGDLGPKGGGQLQPAPPGAEPGQGGSSLLPHGEGVCYVL